MILDGAAGGGARIPEATRRDAEALCAALRALPARNAPDEAARAARRRDSARHKGAARPPGPRPRALARAAIEARLATFNGVAGQSASFDALDALLAAQAYRLAYWRVAADEINYRRFFDINDLAALRMEDPAVFEATHRLVLELLAQGKVDGLRIDHPDGLYDPAGYFARLQQRYARWSAPSRSAPRSGRCTYWRRRSSRRTSSCPRTGRSTAPPAIASPTC